MAVLKLAKLKALIRKSYEAGYNGCLDMADEFIEEAIAEIQEDIKNAKNTDSEWRIYSIEELRKKPAGTIFEHTRLGQGWVEDGGIGKKLMNWNNGEQSFFIENKDPWDEPMREVAKI